LSWQRARLEVHVFAAMTHGELVANVVALSPITPHASSLAAAADAFLDHADVAATAPPMT
jgi:hypothetical protein